MRLDRLWEAGKGEMPRFISIVPKEASCLPPQPFRTSVIILF